MAMTAEDMVSGFTEVQDLDMEMGVEPRDPTEEPGVNMADLPGIIKRVCDEAVNYAEEDLAADRQEGTDYYRGEGMKGDADLDETRSRVISKDVHDTVHAILPSLLRIFFGSQDAVEYTPQGPEDEMSARQATEYVNQIVLQQDNESFMLFFSVFKDALIKGLGTVKWWWDEKTEVVGNEYSGLTQQEFALLAGDPNIIEIYDYEENVDPEFGPLISCSISRQVVKSGQVKMEAVPPEERLISKEARCIDDAQFYGHRRVMRVGELVARGFNYEQIFRLSGSSEYLDTNEEAVERYDNQTFNDSAVPRDPSLRSIEVVEGYFRLDLDGDGIAERYRIFVGGNAYTILEYDDGSQAIDLVEDIPFAEFCPDPEPHLATGNSIAEQVVDVQRVKTNLLRGALDSLSRSIFPREEIVEGQVNVNDVMNPEIGAVIRAKAPGMVREIVTPFMGKETMPLLDYMDDVKANRTGVSDATMGLNPQTLQSATETAVESSVSAAQSQIEMVARILAQSGMCRVFKGLLKCIVTNQDKIRTVRLRNSWQPIDPRAWNSQMDARVVTALGRGTDGDKLNMLNMIASKQELMIQQLGPQNGVCTLAEYRNTVAEMVGITGYFNPDRFLLPVETGQQVQQLVDQNQQTQQELQQAQIQIQQLNQQLEKYKSTNIEKQTAEAEHERMKGLKTAVETVQAGAEMPVAPDALVDDMEALGKIMQSPPPGAPRPRGT